MQMKSISIWKSQRVYINQVYTTWKFRLLECNENSQQRPAFKTFSINNLQKFSSANFSELLMHRQFSDPTSGWFRVAAVVHIVGGAGGAAKWKTPTNGGSD